MRSTLLFAALLPLLVALPSYAQDGLVGFQSPSKNIACIYFEYDNHKALRCDVGDMAEMPPPRPANCELDWGHSCQVEARGSGERSGTGDTQIGQPLPMLRYGEVWQRSGITCKSEEAGVMCFNADRRGFSLSRAKQEVF